MLREAGLFATWPSKAAGLGQAATTHAVNELQHLLSRFSAEDAANDSVFLELRSVCSQPFDRSETGARILSELWNAAFPREPIESACTGSHWKRLGFQSEDPWRDIRAGRFAPVQLHYLACHYPERLQLLAQEAQDCGYPLACSCFNVSHVIALFFDLYEKRAMNPVSGAKKASWAQRNHFARFCQASPDDAHVLLNELFCTLVQQLHDTWKRMHSTGDCTIMDFSSALREIHNSNALFWQTPHRHVAELSDIASGKSAGHTRELVSTLRSLLVSVFKVVLDAVNLQMRKALKVCESALAHGHGRSNMLSDSDQAARSDLKRFGEYVPPTLPQTNASFPTLSCLARPVNDLDLDSFFGEDAAAAWEKSRDLQTDDVVEPGVDTAPDDASGASPDAYAQICVQADSAPCSTRTKQACASSLDAIDLDAFFITWGLSDDPQKKDSATQPLEATKCSDGPSHSADPISSFLDACLTQRPLP